MSARRALSPAARGVLLAASAALRGRVAEIHDGTDGTTHARVVEPDGTVLLDDADGAAVRIAQAERELDEARAEARLDEREACAALLDERADDLDVAESYLVDVDRDEERQHVRARSTELRAHARAIRARGAGGAP